jgi:hypothetical protein
MSAVLKAETPEEGARRLFARELAEGFQVVAMHCYCRANGEPLFYRARLNHPTQPKLIRPLYLDGLRFKLGEPSSPAQGKPLYRLPDLLAAPLATAWVVEGESCADALADLGIVATTSGSAGSASAADWQPLAGRACVIWPDNDAPGRRYGNVLAAKLRALGCKVEIVDIAALALPDKGDCVDWLTARASATAADVQALARIEQSEEAATVRHAPEPLRRPVPPPEPYPVAELGPILAPACESLRRVIQAPDAVCGASLLAAASLAVQGLANVENDGRSHPLSLWFLTVAESGERKSAVDSEAMQPAREYEKSLAVEYTGAAVLHDAALQEWNARGDRARKDAAKAGAVGLADALGAIGPAPPAPLRPIVIVADFTAEGLSKLLATGRPSVGAFTDEAALVFGGHGMTKETVTRTAGTLSKLWDSGTLDRIRASEGAVKLYGRRLALHLMAQPVIAERALSDDLLSGQGFLARCLLAWPESTAGRRPYRAENLRDDTALIHYRARLANLSRRQLPLADGERNELAPRGLRLAPDAFTAWRNVHDIIEGEMAPGKRYATTAVRPWANKAPEQCLRIAGVLTLLENPEAQEIDAATIDRAAELAIWHLNEAARLAGTAELSAEVRDAEAVLEWCHSEGRDKVYSTVALQRGPSRIRELARFWRAMDELVNAGWAEKIDGGAEMDGARRRHVWRIVPKGEGR